MTYISFDTRSGQILSAHYGAMDEETVRYHLKHQAAHHAKVDNEQAAVMKVPDDAVEQGKRYKVDVSRKALVATESQDGVGFSFGLAGRSSIATATRSVI